MQLGVFNDESLTSVFAVMDNVVYLTVQLIDIKNFKCTIKHD